MDRVDSADIDNPERRSGMRIPASATCWIAADSVTVMGRVTDLSDGGLFVLTPCPICRGACVKLSLKLNGDVVEALGRVAWCGNTARDAKGSGLGIRFDHVMNGRKHLARFLEDLSPYK